MMHPLVLVLLFFGALSQSAFADATHGREIPDPNAMKSFAACDPTWDAPDADLWRKLYRDLLAVRRRYVTPMIKGARSGGAQAIGDKAVLAKWANENETLVLACNLGAAAVSVSLPRQGLIWGEADRDRLPSFTTCAWRTP